MAYDRYDSRRGSREAWREPRSRFSSESGDRGGRGWDRDNRDQSDERGFFERAGDEVASWFGDEEAERRRQMDSRDEGRGYRDEGRWARDYDRQSNFRDNDRRSFMGDDENSRYDRQPRFRDEGYRRPYTGRPAGTRGPGERFGPERGTGQREFTGMAGGASSAHHDPHYSEWRRSQIEALDRDYDDYRRENQSRFENDFSSWRTNRQTKRQMLGSIREHMTVVGSDEQDVGTVDKVRGDRIVLTKSDSDDGQHHSINCFMIDRVEGDRVILDRSAADAKREFTNENRNRALFERDDDREPGPHMLNRSFSGTY